MTVTLRALQTAVPPTKLIQEEVRDIFAAQPGLSRLAQRIVSTSFNVSGIDTRYSSIEELTFDEIDHERDFFNPQDRTLMTPGTRTRNELYIKEATKLYVDDFAYIPLHQQAVVWAARKNIDLVQLADNSFPLRFVQVK